MNILFISSYYLFDKTRFGGSKRLYLLAKELQKHANVTVVAIDGCEELQAPPVSNRVHPDFKRFLFVPWLDNRSLIHKFFSSGIIIEKELLSLHGSISGFLAEESYDAAVLAYPLALSFINTFIKPGKFPIVYMEDDLFLEKVQFERKFSFLAPVYRFFRYRQLHAYYQKKTGCCDTLLAISNQEKAILKKHFPASTINVLGYGIPLKEYPFISSFPQRFCIGFIGNYNHTPNIEALRWFLQSVYPTLHAAIPSLSFLVSGRGIPSDIRHDYAHDTSVQWLGDIDDLADFYSKISVFVNPIISGRGMRTKLIECAAFGRPIISTRLGCEGFEEFKVEPAENAEEFTAQCKKLMSDISILQTTAQTNRTIIDERYAIEKVGLKLLSELQPINRTNP